MSLADAITQTKNRIRALESELHRLHAELEEARRALKSDPTKRRARIRKLSKLRAALAPTEPYKPGSSVAHAVAVLREADHHLHINEIVSRIRTNGHEVGKSTLVGNLSRYVKEGQVFTRHSRSHYGLLEWQPRILEELINETQSPKEAAM